MDYKTKYLKYKNKYLQLKKELENSNNVSDYINKLIELYPNCQFDVSSIPTDIKAVTTYGEMEYEGIQKINETLNHDNSVNCFIDIGSGRGKLVCWYANQTGIEKSIGIEIVPERHNDAKQLVSKLNENEDNKNITNKIVLINGDFNNNIFDGVYMNNTDNNNINLQNILNNKKTLVWISNLCFGPNINNDIFRKLINILNNGSFICCSVEIQDSSETQDILSKLIKLEKLLIPMSWNKSNSYVSVYKINK